MSDPLTDEALDEEQNGIVDLNNAADATSIKVKRKRAEEKDRIYAEVMGALLSLPNGREWLAHVLFDLCGVFTTTENAAFDTNAMHFREGARQVGFYLQKMALRADAKLYMVLLTENREKI